MCVYIYNVIRFFLEMACNYTFVNERHGVILTPGYPQENYKNRDTCVWIVEGHAEHVIRYILDWIEIEKHEDCLNVHEIEILGDQSSHHDLASYCQSYQTGTKITTSGRSLRFTFEANNVKAKKGFKIFFDVRGLGDQQPAQDNAPICSDVPKLMQINERKAIGVKITNPGYGKDPYYESNQKCMWQVSGHPNKCLVAIIDFLHLEQSQHCSSDYIEIRPSSNELSERRIGYYCSLRPAEDRIIYTGSSDIFVTFVSNNKRQGKGFALEVSYGPCLRTI